MENGYVKSQNIKVFPSGFRAGNYAESKLTTEENLTNYVGKLSSYLKDDSANNKKSNNFYFVKDSKYIIGIDGYVFVISNEILPLDDGWCVYIKYRDVTGIGKVLASIENIQDNILDKKLTIEETQTEDDYFVGLKFASGSVPSDCSGINNFTMGNSKILRLDSSEIRDNNTDNAINNKFTTNHLEAASDISTASLNATNEVKTSLVEATTIKVKDGTKTKSTSAILSEVEEITLLSQQVILPSTTVPYLYIVPTDGTGTTINQKAILENESTVTIKVDLSDVLEDETTYDVPGYPVPVTKQQVLGLDSPIAWLHRNAIKYLDTAGNNVLYEFNCSSNDVTFPSNELTKLGDLSFYYIKAGTGTLAPFVGKMLPSKGKITFASICHATNLKNGTGSGSLEQVHSSDTFTTINPVANKESDYSGDITTGSFSDSGVMFGGKSRVETGADRALTSGICNIAKGWASTALGNANYAKGSMSTATGEGTTAEGQDSFSEGHLTHAKGQYSHAEGDNTVANGTSSHAEGYRVVAEGNYSHAEGAGSNTIIQVVNIDHLTAKTRLIVSNTSPEIKVGNVLLEVYSGISSYYNVIEVDNSSSSTAKYVYVQGTTIGQLTDSNWYIAKGISYNTHSHCEGCDNTATGNSSHAEGLTNIASGNYSHAEGNITNALGSNSHAEGKETFAKSDSSHAEGWRTTASWSYSHAEGMYTNAKGLASHAEGNTTNATHAYQHVFGEYNILDISTQSADNRGTFVEIVGNGTTTKKSDARRLDWSGNEWLAGSLQLSDIEQPSTVKIHKLTLGTALNNSAGAIDLYGNNATDKVFTVDNTGKATMDQLSVTYTSDSTEYFSVGYNSSISKHEVKSKFPVNIINNSLTIYNGDARSVQKFNVTSDGEVTCAGMLTVKGQTSGASNHFWGNVLIGYQTTPAVLQMASGGTNTLKLGDASNNGYSGNIQVYGTGTTTVFTVTNEGAVTAASYNATSDRRLKENIIEYKPEKSILDLQVKKFDFINGSKNNIGCIAQELQEICPEIVHENEDGFLSIEENKLVYLLLDEVKKLRKEVNELKK